jgi:hypothetical protein
VGGENWDPQALELAPIGGKHMWQEAARRLLNRSYHFQVREVASLLARPLSSKPIRGNLNQPKALVFARNRSPDEVDHNVAASGLVLIAAIVGQFGQYGASDAATCE